MKRAAAALLVALAGCRAADRSPGAQDGGAQLEAAALAGGLVADPRARSLTGAWSLDTDRMCIVPGEGREQRVGILIDYGAGQGCAGSGTVQRSGSGLELRLGDCRVTARFDGDRIVLPPEVPAACDRLCVGRASIAAMTVERQSESVAEAANLRTPGGRALCGS